MSARPNIGIRSLIVIAAWVLMAAAWTPPTVALQVSAGTPPAQTRFGFVFVYVLPRTSNYSTSSCRRNVRTTWRSHRQRAHSLESI